MPRGIFFVSTYPVPGREDEFNDWYSNVHISEIASLPGFVGARRFAPADGDGPYVAIYEMESDDLEKTLADMRAVAESGLLKMSDALSRDPAPSAVLFREIARYPA